MGRKIEFSIVGEPVAQGRPRFSRHGGFVRAYDPAKSRDAKQHVRYAAGEVMKTSGEPLSGAIHFKAQFGIAMPRSQGRKRNPRPRVWRVKKPDLDNLSKLVKDACSKVVFIDDSQIVRMTVEKIQCAQGEAPFTRVVFTELEELSV
jgi:Holliday junction resolvase RusA-like endonuclease